MIIPYEKLKPATLESVIKEFVIREGTEYGIHDISMETKINQVKKQLQAKHCQLVYDPETESINILTKRDAQTFMEQSHD